MAVPQLGGPGGGTDSGAGAEGAEGAGAMEEEAWRAFLLQLPAPAAEGAATDQMEEEDEEDEEDRDYSCEP